jgi:hypothetical protein
MGALIKLYQELTKLVGFCGRLTQVQVLSDTILIDVRLAACVLACVRACVTGLLGEALL